jgi:hypothetical protein
MTQGWRRRGDEEEGEGGVVEVERVHLLGWIVTNSWHEIVAGRRLIMGIYWNQGIISPRGLSARLRNSTLIPSWLNELRSVFCGIVTLY